MITTLEATDQRFDSARVLASPVLWAGPEIEPSKFSVVRRRALLDGCKWDPQVGDTSTLASFPLVMRASTWANLADQAELLSAEAAEAEGEILRRPKLLDALGLPGRLLRVLKSNEPPTPSPGRVVRFDFHHTAEGWKISEANSDVPGGFSEASYFTELVAEHFPTMHTAGNPAAAWSEVLAAAGSGGTIVLLSAPGYMEDHQVIAFLAGELRQRGCRAGLAKPEQIHWREGLAEVQAPWYTGPARVIVKFYQAEWLARLPDRYKWKYFFRGGETRVANPGSAIISESKRFPLVWKKLSTKMPTWERLLPETRDPREVPWARDESWLLKTAFCNNGDTVSIRELMRPADWLRTRVATGFSPQHWVAQKRFESVPIATPAGPRHVCVGVYTVNGKAAGAYARLSSKLVVDFAATDVALLLENDE